MLNDEAQKARTYYVNYVRASCVMLQALLCKA